jgi:hypothetical protein
VIVYRHGDPRFPFLWETPNQPTARWHIAGESPAHYLADTPDGAWAEFLRHEGITEPADLEGIRRTLWAIELKRPPSLTSHLPPQVLTEGSRPIHVVSRRRAGCGAGANGASRRPLRP